jgi:hypothetical protein
MGQPTSFQLTFKFSKTSNTGLAVDRGDKKEALRKDHSPGIDPKTWVMIK